MGWTLRLFSVLLFVLTLALVFIFRGLRRLGLGAGCLQENSSLNPVGNELWTFFLNPTVGDKHQGWLGEFSQRSSQRAQGSNFNPIVNEVN